MKKISLYVLLSLMFCNVSFGGILSEVLKKFEKTSTGCIEGDCENGYGIYVFEDGNKYTGEWKDNKFYGQGTYNFANGEKYSGQWKDDKAHGQGTYEYTNGHKYVGEMKESEFHGQGIYYYGGIDGRSDKGIYKNGELVERN